jgi:ribosomal protein L40E
MYQPRPSSVEVPPPATKVCTKCRQRLPLDAYYIGEAKCKECELHRQRTQRAERARKGATD